jgi:hypothetical protein
MERIGPSGQPEAVTSSAGDCDLNGDLVGRVRQENGTTLKPLPWLERPGFHDRMVGAGQDPEAMRRMIAAGGQVLS